MHLLRTEAGRLKIEQVLNVNWQIGWEFQILFTNNQFALNGIIFTNDFRKRSHH